MMCPTAYSSTVPVVVLDQYYWVISFTEMAEFPSIGD